MGRHALGRIRPIMRHSGRTEYPRRAMPRSAGEPQALVRSADNALAAFLTFLAEEQVSARTARLYLGHLGRFASWLAEQYRAQLLDATSHDLREYRSRLAERQKPASVNAALAALHRFYGWARDAGRVTANPTANSNRLQANSWRLAASRSSSGNGCDARQSGPDPWPMRSSQHS
jgi:Phage integrase, N-terminal SAM-like domain